MDEGRESDIGSVLATIEEAIDDSSGTSSNVATPTTHDVDPAQIRKELLGPRDITRKHDAEGRQEKADYIGAIRQSRDKRNVEIADKQGEVEALRAELRKRLDSLAGKARKKLGLGDKELDAVRARIAELSDEIDDSERARADLPDTREILDAYYEKASTMPLTLEEKRQFLQPEVLAGLTTEEYIALWKRLNPYFLSHVTRQGVRDHNAMIYHSGGLDEFHAGFESILEDGRMLRPPIAVEGLVTRDEESVRAYMDWELEAETEDEAKKRWDSNLNFTWASAPKYPDKTAAHFAAQIVADGIYGGERGNEVFMVFPSDVIASQYNYAFNGWDKDFTEAQSDITWNDVFVWPPELDNPGIPIDAGIVFLPKSIQVDSETGSKYETKVDVIDGEEKRVTVVDTDLVDRFRAWVQGDGRSFLAEAFDELEEANRMQYNTDVDVIIKRRVADGLVDLGFPQDSAPSLVSRIVSELHWREEYPDEVIDRILDDTRAHWKRTSQGIPAEEYWEQHFSTHPELRPAHVVYYDGDPTTAVGTFLQRNNIGRADTSERDGKLLGFDDHHIEDPRSDPRANQGYDELKSLGFRIIEEHFRDRAA